nr:immunoglobulin light chain junction region [Macaca mulatta]MOV61130.1 immunoglobulin light chain junction region [Macaca mulatta]MOV61260.1 immunoglobulin light chain junction region [Macaca mulatta]MOV61471.1 immunoglobulin light chain junction region [Macaca mulatta]MOV61602.1 immunoglobulin light chain junction region [Macaca mulatta]
CQQHNNYPRTF